jgi:5'-nucleotidase
LSAHLSDVRAALDAGVPAAQVYPRSALASEAHPNEVRIAFDGDAVLFSDEAERVYQTQGLAAFQQSERDKATQPLLAGPFKPLLQALQRLQQEGTPQMRLRTALVTARSAPAHERAIRTLMNWNIEVDEAMFLGGLAKGEFLREFEPDFFFDDQTGHIESAAQHVPSGHVASGVSNPPDKPRS